MRQLSEPLAPLGEYKQFILWAITIHNNQPVKTPMDKTGTYPVDAHDSANWMTFQEAVKYETDFLHVGFVFTDNDSFFFVDIDHCLEDGSWSQLAMNLCSTFSGAAIEVSQSGTGLHIIGTGDSPPHSCKNVKLGIEFYTNNRFIALTDKNTIGNAAANFSHQLPGLVNSYFKPRESDINPVMWTNTHNVNSNPIQDDDKLIEKALASQTAANKFGQGLSFADLWNNNVEALADAFPHETKQYDYSSADASLAQRLAFWTGGNCERIKTLMLRSGLVRDKYKRTDYINDTIVNAVSQQREFFGIPLNTETSSDAVTLTQGFQYMPVDRQVEFFKGCVYIISSHKIQTPCGMHLKPEQFNSVYSGYVFQMSNDSSKDTRKPWEAFIDNQCVKHPKVNDDVFRPDLPAGQIIEENGKTYVNSYVPIETRIVDGDITPFTDYFKKLLPDDLDREILWSYMAACVQYPGVKFQWCPLIQGVEGNGKTLLTRAVCFALSEHYSHMPPAHEISEKFNEWLFHKLFIGIEDVYVPSHKQEILEILKPMVTNDRLAMRAMQKSQVMGNNLANFILNSNHKNAIPKRQNDRRFAIFFTAQQTYDDLVKCGMGGDYFPKLYAWLKRDGYAIINKHLQEYAIPEKYNPATMCHRAPETTSTLEAISASMGRVEEQILEAIGEGRPGFCGGWVSSMQLTKLLEEKRMAHLMPFRNRREVMENIGYIQHPALHDGRVDNRILLDGGKPRLYIKQDHINCNITNRMEAAKKYETDQLSQLTAWEARSHVQ